MPTVRCADCGFLGLRNHKTGTLDEADERYRVEVFQRGAPPIHDPIPCCTQFAVNFRDEANPGDQDGIGRALKRDRSSTCAKAFTQWHPGLTPREHHNMVATQELQRFQQEQRELDRVWQAKQEAENRVRQEARDRASREREDVRDKANREWQEQQARVNRKWQVGLAAAAALFGLFGVWLGKALSTPPPIVIQTPAETKDAPK